MNRFVVVRLASGKATTYGPLAYPPEITRLVSAMWSSVRRGQSAVSPPTARRDARRLIATWSSQLRRRARRDLLATFPNLPRRVFFARLHRLADRYHFRVVRARILRPAQDAPFVVVQANDQQAFARALPAIRHQLDPKRRTKDDRTGWAYEGFFLEALDSRGSPFLAIFNFERGPGAGGGQWASRDSLFPYPHG